MCLVGTDQDTENDFLLAQMIQLEYDKEYDRTIDSMEKRYNGESKGTGVSLTLLCRRSRSNWFAFQSSLCLLANASYSSLWFGVRLSPSSENMMKGKH